MFWGRLEIIESKHLSWHLEWHKHSVMTADLMNIHRIAVSRNLEMSNKRRVLK